MLVLSRKKHEGIVIKGQDGDIRIVLIDVDRGRVRIGIDAPRGNTIVREELLVEIESMNRLSAVQDLGKITKLIGGKGE
jgi:carbon storage regulator